MKNFFEVVDSTEEYQCFLLHHKHGPLVRWSAIQEDRAFKRLEKQSGWVQYRKSVLELHSPDGTIAARSVKGIFEDYRTTEE